MSRIGRPFADVRRVQLKLRELVALFLNGNRLMEKVRRRQLHVGVRIDEAIARDGFVTVVRVNSIARLPIQCVECGRLGDVQVTGLSDGRLRIAHDERRQIDIGVRINKRLVNVGIAL